MEETVERFLCMVSADKIYGMKLSRLMQAKKEVIDSESLPSPPLDFSLDLPRNGMTPFVFDSRVHMTEGLVSYGEDPSYKIYEFDIDNETKKPLLFVTDSIPEPLAHLDTTTFDVANVSGDVYFRQYKRHQLSLWVLCSDLKQWKLLPLPSRPLGFPLVPYWEILSFCNKLALLTCRRGNSYFLYSFDPLTATWMLEDDGNVANSFHHGIDGKFQIRGPSILVSIPDLSNSNCSVMLSWSFLGCRTYHCSNESLQIKARVCALLVNKSGVFLYQHLEECFEGIDPTFYNGCRNNLLVDLGNGMVCAILFGHSVEHDGGLNPPILYISIFTLAKAECDFDANTGAPPPKDQRFLSVHVLAKHMFRHGIQ